MRHLVIFDMEWNMGYRPKTFQYHGAEQVLRGEILQIGAVKMDGQNIQDTFQATLRPRIFKKLHHQVARVTGLTQKDLNKGLPLDQGLQTFRAWCGKDAVLGEWGLDDVPVLKQNLFLSGQDERWPSQWYDLQKVYLSQHPRKEGEGMTLKSVVERLGIQKDEAFHDALADAMYTAKVMQYVDIEAGLAVYPDEVSRLREQLCPADQPRHDFTIWKGLADGEAWRTNPQIRTARCPVCGAPLVPDADDLWLSRGNNCLYSMGTCRQHGPAMVWLRRSHADGLHYLFARATEPADRNAQIKWKTQKQAAVNRARYKQKQESRSDSGSRQNRRSSRSWPYK